jgi:threonine synthase
MAISPFDVVAFESENWFQCMDCGRKAAILAERRFRCPDCGGLYDVEHRFSWAKGEGNTPSMAYRDFADYRRSRSAVHNNGLLPDHRRHSDVWAFDNLVMPRTPRLVTLGERITFVPAGRHLRHWLGYGESVADVDLALEGLSPTGSFKDFGGAVLASVAWCAGAKSLVCASTGDTSAMAAAYAAAAGLKCLVLLPEGHVSPVQLVQPMAYGAKIILVPGDFDACMAIMRELIESYGAYPANSVNAVRIEGHQATVFNAWQYLPFNQMPDWIVAPVGNGSNISGVGKGQRVLKALNYVSKTSRLLGCQAEHAAPLARSWRRFGQGGDIEAWRAGHEAVQAGATLATAQKIGNPVSAAKVMREISSSDGRMATASDAEIIEAIRVCGSDGHFVCPQTGVALAGLRDARMHENVTKDESVLIVSTAAGIKFPNVLDSLVESHIVRLARPAVAEAAKHLHE